MVKEIPLEQKVRECAAELEECAALIRDLKIEPIKKNVYHIATAIGELSDLMVCFETFREEVSKPYKRKCSFCKIDEDHAAKLIQWPGVWICNSCVGDCNEILERAEDYSPVVGESVSIKFPAEATVGQLKGLLANYHYNTKVKVEKA